MKKILEKLVPFMLALAVLIYGAAFANAETADGAEEAAKLLDAVKGTYEALFPVITRPEYDQIWLDPCVAAAGEEQGPAVAEMLKTACNGTVYGQEAIDAFGDGSNGAQFDCLFINGVSTITFDGSRISGADKNGGEVFSHEYTYAGRLSLSGLMEGYLFETTDADAGEFTYFYLMPDTPATTYHLEFRYGSSKEDLAKYNEGPYAYWLAAGFPVDADETMDSMTEGIFMTAAFADQTGISYAISAVLTDVEAIPENRHILNRQSKQSIMDSFDIFMDLMNKMIWLLVIAAVVLGIVVLYNLGVMSYTERYREMATLKVVGFKDSKIGRLLISQNLWLTVLGILIGIPAGVGVLQYLLTALASEYELKLTLGLPTWLVSILLTFGVSLFVGLMVARKNRHIDMVAALKTAE